MRNDKIKQLNKMNKIVYLILLIALFVSCIERKENCTKLLNEEIRFPEQNEDFENCLNEFLYKYQQIFLCEFDTIDYFIAIGPKKDMPQMAYASMCVNKGKREIHYREIVDVYKAFMQTDEYVEIREKLEKIPQINWGNSDEVSLEELGFGENQISEMTAQKMEISLEMEELTEGLSVYIDYEKGINKSKELNKKRILYFTGKTCANSRHMNEEILADTPIQELINENYVMICLYVDDREKLAEKEVYYSEILERNIERKGQIYLEMQKRDYNTDFQPFFVILNTKDTEIAREKYVGNIEKFRKFLTTAK